jgi:hypothetical protein
VISCARAGTTRAAKSVIAATGRRHARVIGFIVFKIRDL